MSSYEFDFQKKHLEDLFERSKFFDSEPEMLSHWAKYLCVLTSGFIERAIRHYLSEFASKNSHSKAPDYVFKKIKKFQNPSMKKILDIFGEFDKTFDKTWKKELAYHVEGERKDSIDSIVANRNKIAHGGSTGLTIAQMKKYFKKANEVMDFIREQCDPGKQKP